MKILLIDNYDSFTYNLVHYLEPMVQELDVFRNDRISVEVVAKYDKIVLSPGPGLPSEAGIMPEIISKFTGKKSILGICLGLQGIVEACGGVLENMQQVMHGVQEQVIVIDPNEKLFQGVPTCFQAGLYHSWMANPRLPAGLRKTAETASGIVMAVSHEKFDLRAVQFHPESIMTEWGRKMLENWVGL